jgi:chromosome segregation ATPase
MAWQEESSMKERSSYDYDGGKRASTSSYHRDVRDDIESSGRSAIEISEEKVQKFDDLLKKIENERKKMNESTPPRVGSTVATPRRAVGGIPVPPRYDFANRARELRMSLDADSSKATPPRRTESFSHSRSKSMTPHSAGGTPIHSSSPVTSRLSFDARSERVAPPDSYKPTPRSSSSGNMIVRSLSHAADTKEARRGNDEFTVRVEKFQKNMMYAHDTISSLERDVRNLKKKLEDKDDSITTLERRNKSLNETLVDSRDEMAKLEKERSVLLEEKNGMAKKHEDELDQLKKQCDGYKTHVEEIGKLSAEAKVTVEEIRKAKENLENTVSQKDQMIGSLRTEIKRLNEELADGSFVRAQAKKAEDRAKELETELQKSKADHEAAAKIIMGLEVRIQSATTDTEKALREKCQELDILKAEMRGSTSSVQRSEGMVDKVAKLESDLNRSTMQKDELAEKVEVLERRLEQSGRASKSKDEEIEDLMTQLETKSREMQRQRIRFEEYDKGCAVEQDTIGALEQAIEELERAHNESGEEIARLQTENQGLNETLQEAEHCMLMYKEALQDSSKFKTMLGELKEINGDLGEQLREREENILELKTKEVNLSAALRRSNERISKIEEEMEIKIQASVNESKHRVQELEDKLAEKSRAVTALQNEIAELKSSSTTENEELKTLREEANLHQVTEQKLNELSQLFEEKESEFEELNTNKEKMLGIISKLENELEQLRKERKSRLAAKGEQEVELEKSQKDAKKAWRRVSELEEEVQNLEERLSLGTSNANSDAQQLKSELASTKKKLAKRDEQLEDSKKGIAEAQKMIYKLMETVQELRRRVKVKEQANQELATSE